MEIIHRKDWDRPGIEVTPEVRFLNRRRLLKMAGAVGIAASVPFIYNELSFPPSADPEKVKKTIPAVKPPFPFKRSALYTVPERGVTPELTSAVYNNFYELGTDKSDPWQNGHLLKTEPFTLEVTGLCKNPQKFSLDDLMKKFTLEERLYRFRCVEAWAATVPWSGFALHNLLKLVEPKSEATHVRFFTTGQKDLPGIKSLTWYTWPYYEALTLNEAMAELTLLTVGSYGHALPNQHGAPARLIVPWKYGYKSPKSIVKIELVKGQPKTFWNDLQPLEYSFESNVNPKVPHPRWSQASERLLDDGSRVPTKYLNGYEKHVGHLYA